MIESEKLYQLKKIEEVERIINKLVDWVDGEKYTEPENFRSSWGDWDIAKRKAAIKALVERGSLRRGMERRKIDDIKKTVTSSEILEQIRSKGFYDKKSKKEKQNDQSKS